MKQQSCPNCKFCLTIEDESSSLSKEEQIILKEYLCRRYPPQTIAANGIWSQFPTMQPDDWCGEYEGLESKDGEYESNEK